jgi:hypothetical protein
MVYANVRNILRRKHLGTVQSEVLHFLFHVSMKNAEVVGNCSSLYGIMK